MNSRKVVTREEIINRENDLEIFGPIKEKIVNVVLEVLGGLKDSLEKELSGIGLLVMDAVMELEVTKVAGVKGKHQKQRQYNWWGKNPGSVILDGKRVKRLIPRA